MDLTQTAPSTISIETIVMLVFYLVLGAYVIFSAVLYYHWKTYGTDTAVTSYTLIVFFATTIPLMIITATLALMI
jgi:hypothetical protein